MPQGVTVNPQLNQAIMGTKAALDPRNDSVLDPWYERLLKQGGRLLGAGDPTQTPLTPSITGFVGPTGIPNVLGRQAATATSMEELKKTLEGLVMQGRISPNEMQHSLNMAAKYPRVVAHVSEFEQIPVSQQTKVDPLTNEVMRVAGNEQRGFKADPTVQDKFSKIKLGDSIYTPRTLVHELTHSAQRIADPKATDMKYQLYNAIVGYKNNPLEKAARKVDHPWSGPVMQMPNQHLKDPFWQQLLGLQDFMGGR